MRCPVSHPPCRAGVRSAHAGPRRWRTAGGVVAAALALLAGCAAPGPAPLVIDDSHVAVSQDSRVRVLVLHYTQADFPRAMQILARGGLSVHYLLSDESPPRIYRLVDENRRAYHAGQSSWQGAGPLNAISIGIEVVHPGVEQGPQGPRFLPWREDQIAALIPLVADIVRRHEIPPDRVVGHSDVAPQRKVDPGPLFPWARLAERGLVAWPDAARVAAARPGFERQLPDATWFQQALAGVGYEVPRHGAWDEPTRRVLAAFQMKYRPARHDGQPDAESAALLAGLLPAGSPDARPNPSAVPLAPRPARPSTRR